MKPSHYRTELKNVRGLGAAHDGTHHFWVQRVSALALVPLSVWFMIELVTRLSGSERPELIGWFHHPVNALLTAILVTLLFWHSRLGVQVIIEDYAHTRSKKLVLLLLGSGLNLLLCGGALLAIAHLHFFEV